MNRTLTEATTQRSNRTLTEATGERLPALADACAAGHPSDRSAVPTDTFAARFCAARYCAG